MNREGTGKKLHGVPQGAHIGMLRLHLGGDAAGLELVAVGLQLLVKDVVFCNLLLHIGHFGAVV